MKNIHIAILSFFASSCMFGADAENQFKEDKNLNIKFPNLFMSPLAPVECIIGIQETSEKSIATPGVKQKSISDKEKAIVIWKSQTMKK